MLLEFWEYIIRNKKWWIAPILFLIVVLSFIVVFAQSATIGPFMYAMF